MIFESVLKDPQNIYFDGEDPDEKILYVFRRSVITNVWWILLSILMLSAPWFIAPVISSVLFGSQALFSPAFSFILFIFWHMFTFAFIFQSFLNWFYNVYIISNKRIVDIDFHGLLYKNISEASLQNIEDVTSRVSGFFRVIFNYGDVLIQTAAEHREFEFGAVDDPSKVRDILSDLVTKNRGHHD